VQIERETTIQAPVERVWALITEAEHVGRWFGDAGAEIDLRPGGEMVMRWEEHGTAYGRVVDVEAPHRFSYRWGDSPELTESTLVEFTVADAPEGTLLRVRESGFASTKQFEDNTEGWRIEIGHLVEYAERVTA
jgi:uncharacterized protein YndB with AHSA1/START domain